MEENPSCVGRVFPCCPLRATHTLLDGQVLQFLEVCGFLAAAFGAASGDFEGEDSQNKWHTLGCEEPYPKIVPNLPAGLWQQALTGIAKVCDQVRTPTSRPTQVNPHRDEGGGKE